MNAREVNFDGLVGPTHNYGGLSYGNLASMKNLGGASNPRAAVLQGLEKMRALMGLGLTQGVLPPHERPSTHTLRSFGFSGTDTEVIESAWKISPQLVINSASASAMWTANAATVSPSADTENHKVHFTPANLGSMFHRSIEAGFTARSLKTIFKDEAHFEHHAPVPYGGRMGDEGAANHGRLAVSHSDPGVELFVYGSSAFEKIDETEKFQARQALEASQGVAAAHRLAMKDTVFARQSQKAINAGAFHNDVVSVTNGKALFYHEDAFADTQSTIDAITTACAGHNFDPVFIEVPSDRVSLEGAISTYLFNSQLITLPDGTMALILPSEAEEHDPTRIYVAELTANNACPISQAFYFDLKQSMKNGGGPACLRLRVVLTDEELTALSGVALMTEERLSQLEDWATLYYRDHLMPDDLRDPQLLVEANTALDKLTQILNLGSLYAFQQ